MRFSACIEVLFTELPFTDRIKKASEMGFDAIEFWSWKDKDLELLKSECNKNKIEVSGFTGVVDNQMVDSRDSEKCVTEFRESLEAAEFLNCKRMVLHVNTIQDDQSAKPVIPEISDIDKKKNIIHTLNKCMPLAEDSEVISCFEPLNTLVDHKGYFLNSSKQAFDIIGEIGSPKLKMLYDIYHMHVMGEDVISTIEGNIDSIGYIHIADVPGRHQPGTGEIDFEDIYNKLSEISYKGYIGFEYMPSIPTEDSLTLTKKIFRF